MNAKNVISMVFLTLTAVIIGGLIGDIAGGISWLNWLTYGKTIALSPDAPAVLDLIIIKLVFAAEISMNIAQVILIIGAIFINRKFFK